MTDPNLFGPIDVHTPDLASAVYTVIGHAIRDGRLAAGERLRDVELAEWLGVSRTPVREALLRLERIGLVEMVAGRFTRVSEVTPELVTATLEYIGYQVGAATRMAMHRMSDDELAEAVSMADSLVAIVEKPQPASEQPGNAAPTAELFAACAAFFGFLTAASGNGILHAVMLETAPAVQRNLRDVTLPLSRAEHRRSFTELRDAVAARDGDWAELVVRRQHGIVALP